MRIITTTNERVRYFRALRSHLVGPSAADPVECAAQIAGAQAQVESCALHAISLRTAGRPTAEQVRRLILNDDHTLIRTWGQRGTLHLYAANEWPLFVTARQKWSPTGRRADMPPDALTDNIGGIFLEAGRPLLRSDFFDELSDEFVESFLNHPEAGKDPRRFAASQVIRRLAGQGHIIFAHKEGSEQAYAHRSLWHGDMEWPELDADEASTQVLRRYLKTFGPATVQDMAHYLGASVTNTRKWTAMLAKDLIEVKTEDRNKLFALADDADTIRQVPAEWPARLVPGYDTMLMTHKDKSWVIDTSEEKLVWKKSAVVMPTVISRGRIVATWKQEVSKGSLRLSIEPLSAWHPALMPDLERDADELAEHLGVALSDVQVGGR